MIRTLMTTTRLTVLTVSSCAAIFIFTQSLNPKTNVDISGLNPMASRLLILAITGLSFGTFSYYIYGEVKGE